MFFVLLPRFHFQVGILQVVEARLPNSYLIVPNRFLITLTCTWIWVKSLNQSRTHQCMRIIIIVVYAIVTITNSTNRLIKHTLMYFGHHGVNQLRQASKGVYILGLLLSYLIYILFVFILTPYNYLNIWIKWKLKKNKG